MKKGSAKKKGKKNVEYIYINDENKQRTLTVKTAPSGNKYIQATLRGKVKKITAPTLKDLEAAVNVYLSDIDGQSGANITYYNACIEYINTHAGLAENTRINYLRLANGRLKSLHDKPIMKLTKQDIYNAVNEDLEKHYAPKSMGAAISFLLMICNEFEVPVMTVKFGNTLKKYARTATKGNKGRKSNNDWDNVPSAFEVAEWAGDEADKLTALCVLLDLHSLRSEETRGLQYRDVFEDKGKCYMNICRTRTYNSKDIYRECTKNDSSTRKILIDRRLYEMIHTQAHESDTDFVINRSYKSYLNAIKAIMQAHDVGWIRPHDIRHIYKTTNKDNSIATAVGGWSNRGGVSETVYTHTTQKEMDEFMTKYSGKLLDSYEGIVNITVSKCG